MFKCCLRNGSNFLRKVEFVMANSKNVHSPERKIYLDVVKGIAIISVVLGHCIQFGSGREFLQSEAFFADAVFKAIYGCHMALFMLVSGYLFGISLKRHTWSQVFASRFTSLLLPLMSWGLIGVVVAVIHYHGIVPLLKAIVWQYLYHMWFIWAIFYNSLFVLMLRRFCKDSALIYFIAWLLLFVIPDAFNLSLYKYMYPYFLCGYLTCKFDLLARLQDRICSNWGLLMACAVSYVLLMQFFVYESYIYTSHYSIVNFKTGAFDWWKLGNDIYRMVTAFAGSGLVLLSVYTLWKKTSWFPIWKLIAKLGKASLVVYLFSSEVIFFHVLPKITQGFVPSYLITLLETVIILFVCYLVYMVMKNVTFLNKLFLGGR